MSKKNTTHSYSALSPHDPDEAHDSDNMNASKAELQHRQADPSQTSQSQMLSDRGRRRSLDPTDPTAPMQRQQPHWSDKDNSSEDEDDEVENPVVSESKHLHQYWVRYLILTTVLAGLAALAILLIVRTWKSSYYMAPVYNEAVKALPEEQPVWPIPKSFTFGKQKVLLSKDFYIQTTVFNDQQFGIAPILEKAIGRLEERLQLKRNMTLYRMDSVEPDYGDNIPLTKLAILVDNAQAALEYGMIESYTLEIPGRKSANSGNGDSAPYAFQVHSAVLRAATQWGVIHGLETFSQLVRAQPMTTTSKINAESISATAENVLVIPNVPWIIRDEPRYSHRGILLDTSRNYIPVKDIIKTIEAMSIVKFNVFHWHVLDQQSYPLVSKTYPDLTAKGAERPDYIYTSEDVAYIVQYGEERGIRVLPEFDSPGHAASWGRAYPNLTVCLDMEPHRKYAAEPPAGQLDPLEPFTYILLDNLIQEWGVQFPDKHVHVGGDEVNFDCWKTSKRLRDYIEHAGRRGQYEDALLPTVTSPSKENKMRTTRAGPQSGEDKLLELYLDKVFGMFMAQGKRPIVWEEIALEHKVKLPDSAIVQVWKNAVNAKRVIEQGWPVILSSAEYWYLDCGSGQWLIGSQGQSWCKYSNWQRVYSYSLTDQLNTEQQKMVYGGEICMWSEQTDASNLHSNIWPRAAAAAEVLWSGSQDENGQDRPLIHAAKRLTAVRDRLVQMGVAAAPIYPSWCRHSPEGCLA
ncbi:hypothetical protein BX616_003602 [Lobosporangium transversale]|uniref:beta-N-acetylhexosaminidase n=1 Tax=Lobosporangium transversale TaxID=64571 RepID=A0A1Y2GWZ2_9FUNG|nr:glycoside hydrolase superfamily [Lobosporangium transversale]KAF9916497.1 hypothetical protein BX616_003602 [Lobosporangium transversale]ORZ26291.1 glycoside hydrolase superfamily [Lobosporangium transversale]|eukprot:XP_021884056.1 glycoside hydrolase superfamily [Lobosporangium transversale]